MTLIYFLCAITFKVYVRNCEIIFAEFFGRMGGGKRSRGTPGSNLGKALKSARDKNTVGHRRVVNEGISHIHASEVHKKEAYTTDPELQK